MPYPDEPSLRDENIVYAGSSGTGTQAYTTASVQTDPQTHVLLEVLHDLPGQDPLIPIMTIDSSKNAVGNQKLREEANQNNVGASKNPRHGAKTKTNYGGPPGYLQMLARNFNSCVVSHLDSFSRAAVQVP